jgi:hypothetical protein
VNQQALFAGSLRDNNPISKELKLRRKSMGKLRQISNIRRSLEKKQNLHFTTPLQSKSLVASKSEAIIINNLEFENSEKVSPFENVISS